jgi:RND family efflux transporter MFP subunit
MLELKKAGATPAAIAVAQAQISSTQTQVATIQTQISNQSIIAPVDGVITQVNVEIGEQSSSANPIIQMQSNADFEINTDIAETDIDKIKIGDKAIVTFDAFTKDKKLTGTVVEIDPSATAIQGVIYYKTKVILDAQDNKVKPGMTANLEIITAEKKDVLAVPNPAVKTNDQEEKYVDILTNTETFTTESKTIKTGLRGNTHTEITEGLTGGESIIILENK